MLFQSRGKGLTARIKQLICISVFPIEVRCTRLEADVLVRRHVDPHATDLRKSPSGVQRPLDDKSGLIGGVVDPDEVDLR